MLTGLGKILILLGFMPTISCVTARNKPASEETKPPSGHKSNPANKGDSPNDVAHARFLEDLYKRIMKFTPKYADVDLAHHPIPPGDLLDIGGYKVYIHCTGEPGKSGKTVVINTGSGASAVSWAYFQEEISNFTQVCIWDRPGYGWSELGPNPRTLDQIVKELHTLLGKKGIDQQLIVMGQSYGGLIARE